MRSRSTRSAYLASSLYGGDGDQDEQEVSEHPDGDDHYVKKNNESPSEADKEEENEVTTVMLGRCTPAT